MALGTLDVTINLFLYKPFDESMSDRFSCGVYNGTHANKQICSFFSKSLGYSMV